MFGGSTSSLLTLLNKINYEKYDVTLCLYEKGDLIDKVNKKVKIVYAKDKKINRIHMFLYSIYTFRLFILLFTVLFSKTKNKINHIRVGLTQIGAKYRAKKSKQVDTNYDYIIGYLEFWANEYASLQNKSTKKIFWIHSDYLKSNMNYLFDKKKFNNAYKIVFVADECVSNFNLLTNNKYINKTIKIENMFDINYIKSKSKETIDDYKFLEELTFVSPMRMEYYTKGLDRCILVAQELKNRHINFKWIFIGDGIDLKKFELEIKENNLENYVICLGKKQNPYKYMRRAQAIIMLSRYEGKPMVVREAQILERTCIVTNYSSANSQIENMKTGLICDNDDLFSKNQVVEYLLDNKLIKQIENNLKKIDFSNTQEIKKIDELLS